MRTHIERLAIWLLFFCAVTGYGASFFWNAIYHPERSLPLGILWHQLKFFTLWTNILLIFLSGYMAIRQKYLPDSLFAAVTLWMTVVFLVWHGILSDGKDRFGLDFYSNALGHTINPILLGLIWIWWAPKSKLVWKDAFIWLAWPLAYVIYVVIRGQITGFYPYFFLNIPELGWAGFATWVLRFLAGFCLGGLAFVALGKRLPKSNAR